MDHETVEDRKRRLKRERQNRWLAQQTPEQSQRRRDADAAAHRYYRQHQSLEQLQRRRNADAVAHQYYRQHQSPEQLQRRWDADAAAHRYYRQYRTPEQLQRRRAADALAHQNARQQQFLKKVESMAEPVQSTSSDSINKLRQFRLQKKTVTPSQLQSSILDMQMENRCSSPLSAGKDQDPLMTTDKEVEPWEKGVYLVPDLPDPDVEEPSSSADGVEDVEEKNGHFAGDPESFLQVIFTDGSQSTKTSSTDEPTTQPYPVSINEIKREIDSDSESKSTRPLKRKKRESTYCDVLKERERSLKLMMDTFPHSDIMEMQDILLFADWDVDQAIAFVNEHPPPEGKTKKSAAQTYSKMYKESTESAQGPVLESEEIGTDGWLATPNKVTLKTYSKNTVERKIVLPNTKPVVFYGTKERARVKRQVEAFLRRQRFKECNEDEANQFDEDEEANQLEVDSEPETNEAVDDSIEIKLEN